MERTTCWLLGSAGALLWLSACSSNDTTHAPLQTPVVAGTSSQSSAGTTAAAAGSGSVNPTPGSSAAGSTAPGAQPPVTGAAGTQSNRPLAGTGAAGMQRPATAGAAAAAGAIAPPPAAPPGVPPKPNADPQDGDPSAPVVAIPNITCGVPRVLGLPQTNVTIGGRGVHVAYPCNKHKGAPVTFFLNLHGTMMDESIKLYQVGYFSAHNLVNSHNLIMVAPKAVGSQWGNGDNGADDPHLMAVIQWVYDTFKDFDIRAMWVGGHSWGGAFTAKFGCKPELADKVKGLVMMSGGGVGGFGGAACADKVAVILTTAEGDNRMPSDQSMLAMTHGCQTAMSEVILNNQHTFWPACTPGFVHANYYMLGKQHATSMDAEVVKSIADWIKLSRQ
jgi:hypothetical protein